MFFSRNNIQTWLGGILGMIFFTVLLIATSPPPEWQEVLSQPLDYKQGQSSHTFQLQFPQSARSEISAIDVSIELPQNVDQNIMASSWEIKIAGNETSKITKKPQDGSYKEADGIEKKSYYLPEFSWGELPSCATDLCTYSIEIKREDVNQPPLTTKVRVTLQGKNTDKPAILNTQKPSLTVTQEKK